MNKFRDMKEKRTWEEAWNSFKEGRSEDPAQYQKAVELWKQNSEDLDWERGDRVDTYCYEVYGTLDVDGYEICAYGTLVPGGNVGWKPDEIEGVEITTPEGQTISLNQEDIYNKVSE